jgi:catechol 2,3-dioxygenase-like lactoylglutathione lyase family enzyme
MPKFVQVTPILEVKDVRASEAFYREKLGFRPGEFFGDPPVFCICGRENVSIFLDQSRTPRPTPLNQYWAAYFYVDNVDELAAEFQSRGVEIIRGPCDQDYGCREIDVRDPDGHIIGFGQNRASSAGNLTLP